MGSPLTPKHAEDLVRVVRGALLVAARAAADSPLLQQVMQADLKAATTRGAQYVTPATPRSTDAGRSSKEVIDAQPVPKTTTTSHHDQRPTLLPQMAEPLAAAAEDSQGPTDPESTKSLPTPPEPQLILSQEEPTAGSTMPGGAAAAEHPLEATKPEVVPAPEATVVEAAAKQPAPQSPPKKFREAAVPSSPLGRVVGFAGLGASLAIGALRDNASMWLSGSAQERATRGHPLMTERNAERLADALCRMRGAALKLGQMLSIQDDQVLPPQLLAALERVREGADVMPSYQLEAVLVEQLGDGWRAKVADFDSSPLAAASIGQVHKATLLDGREVAMKVQYPGVARSIESDVDNVMRLIRVANVLPKGAYVEQAVRVAKKELALECDYRNEMDAQALFKRLIEEDTSLVGFNVPDVVPELCSERVLTTEFVPGIAIDKVASMSQEVRDRVATRLLTLTLKELFEWRFMQTDPNWGNFLYDESSDTLQLIDFGAARHYPKEFVDDYLKMVKACAEEDKDEVLRRSIKLGFLTGEESGVMLDAHVKAGFVVGLPFSAEGLYDFGAKKTMTREVTDLGGVMVKHRLTPPPEEAYSLHRKLSGAFLSCIKLNAKVPCRDLFMRCYGKHIGSPAEPMVSTAS